MFYMKFFRNKEPCARSEAVQIPKPKRLRNKKAIEAVRKPYCELCGRRDMGLHVHHIITKGSGGPDHRCNLITLCAECHTKAHVGCLSQDRLWQVVGQREDVKPSAVTKTAQRLKRAAHVGEVN
ncbi:MAG TPA: HNH endonuclease [Tepidimicrobium sp.]|nr:HNH endonuclease [Tepidimicrobium sp.]